MGAVPRGAVERLRELLNKLRSGGSDERLSFEVAEELEDLMHNYSADVKIAAPLTWLLVGAATGYAYANMVNEAVSCLEKAIEHAEPVEWVKPLSDSDEPLHKYVANYSVAAGLDSGGTVYAISPNGWLAGRKLVPANPMTEKRIVRIAAQGSKNGALIFSTQDEAIEAYLLEDDVTDAKMLFEYGMARRLTRMILGEARREGVIQ